MKAEAKRYDDDAVPWDAVDLARCLGSTKVVDLVAAPPRGLLPLLDEQVKLGVRGADAAFLTQADKAHKDCDVYGKPRFDRDKQGGKSTAGLGGPRQTSELSISITSKSIRLIFGRIDCSRRVLEARPKSLRRNGRICAH